MSGATLRTRTRVLALGASQGVSPAQRNADETVVTVGSRSEPIAAGCGPDRWPHRTAASRAGRRRSEAGTAVIEAVVGVTAFGLFVSLTVAGGRVVMAHQAVETAANDAARAASIARTAADATADATAAATGSLRDQDLACTVTAVHVDTSGFAAPLGTTAQVRATVSCTMRLSDLALPGMPASRTITETVSSPIDAYRERR